MSIEPIFKIDKIKQDNKLVGTRLPIEEKDGAHTYRSVSGSQFIKQGHIDPQWKTESDLIEYYRDMAMNHIIDRGIDEIVSDAIVVDRDRVVSLDFSQNSKLSQKIQDKITEEFDNVLDILNFKQTAHVLFREWYIDGRLAFYIVIDKDNTKNGILGLQKLDVAKLKHVKQLNTNSDSGVEKIESIDEFFVYDMKNQPSLQYMFSSTGSMILSKESVSYTTSGLIDRKNNWVVSYLHKAIRPTNHLKLLEDAALIYKLVRAPERRVFYIDVGTLPKNKAEEYVSGIMSKHRNKVVYNAVTGEVKDDKKAMSMTEDYWLPRRDGCFSLNTRIHLANGSDVELGQLIADYNNGIDNWVLSVDKEGNLYPGIVSWAGVTRKNANILRVYLNSGEVVDATPDHKFILSNGKKVKAQSLKEGAELASFYRDSNFSISTGEDYVDYEDIVDELSVSKSLKRSIISESLLSNTSDKSTNEWVTKKLNSNIHDNITRGYIHNYKKTVVKIQYLDELVDVGTLTIDENHLLHDHHNFSLSTGIFVMNSKGTEIDTLPGGNTQSTEDLDYFKKNMYESLNIPVSRLESNSPFSIGRSSEISRDEVRFSSFINKLRNTFSGMFNDLLYTQLMLKGVITESDWPEIKNDLDYVFESNILFAEMKQAELWQTRLANLDMITPHIDKFFSKEWVQKNILYFSDSDIENIDNQIKEKPFKVASDEEY